MASRATSAPAPTASAEVARRTTDSVIPLLAELRGAWTSGGSHESAASREARMYSLIESKRDQITMTLCLMLPPGDQITRMVNNSLLGMRWNKDVEQDMLGAAPPLHEMIELQSLRTHCPGCDVDPNSDDPRQIAMYCGRKGKYHDVVYKTSQKGGTGSERNMVVAMGGTIENNVLCKVDPETGIFHLPPLEAKKALRQWGEMAVRATRRWVDRENRKGDRWKIREVRHHELYAHAGVTEATPQGDVPAMAAD